jgi:hypothetical protein
MRIPLRLAGSIVLAWSVCISAGAAACSIEPLLEAPPRSAGESEAEFAAREDKWYRDITERQVQETLHAKAAHEDRLWKAAGRIVLARIERVERTQLEGSEGQGDHSPLVTLRPVRWYKGSGPAGQMEVHSLSDDSCGSGAAGDALYGDVGDLVLLFYRRGPIDPRNILATFKKGGVVTERSLSAFDLQAGPGMR